MRKINLVLACFLILVTARVFAEVPVVDLSRAVSNETDAAVTTTSDDYGASAVVSSSSVAKTLTVTTPAPSVSHDGTIDERLTRLEQQVNNLAQMNLPKRIDDLDQQVQKLNGQVDVNTHGLQALGDQLRDFYRDLEQRLNQVKAGVTAVSATTTTPATNVSTNTTAAVSTHAAVTQTAAALPAPAKSISSDVAQNEPKEQKAYENAFSLLQQKKYQPAVEALNAYVKDYPKGTYIVNAHYWLGEVYYLLADYKNSGVEFKTIVDKYPQSVKVPDALFKLAMINSIGGKKEQAKKEFLLIKTRYPNSSAAKLAAEQLK